MRRRSAGCITLEAYTNRHDTDLQPECPRAPMQALRSGGVQIESPEEIGFMGIDLGAKCENRRTKD